MKHKLSFTNGIKDFSFEDLEGNLTNTVRVGTSWAQKLREGITIKSYYSVDHTKGDLISLTHATTSHEFALARVLTYFVTTLQELDPRVAYQNHSVNVISTKTLKDVLEDCYCREISLDEKITVIQFQIEEYELL